MSHKKHNIMITMKLFPPLWTLYIYKLLNGFSVAAHRDLKVKVWHLLSSYLSVRRRTNRQLRQHQLTRLPWQLPTEQRLLLDGDGGARPPHHLRLWDSQPGAAPRLQLRLPGGETCRVGSKQTKQSHLMNKLTSSVQSNEHCTSKAKHKPDYITQTQPLAPDT